MAIEIGREDPAADTVELDRKLWLTADRKRVVEDGDPQAAFLYGSLGTRVPRDEAEHLGALPAPPKPKQAERAEDKQAERAEDKGQARRRRGSPDDAGR